MEVNLSVTFMRSNPISIIFLIADSKVSPVKRSFESEGFEGAAGAAASDGGGAAGTGGGAEAPGFSVGETAHDSDYRVVLVRNTKL